ncbi:RNA degradosome polyphosphate kinase [Micromonospora sp. DSM 115977]|uniref:Polyphosphate kinase n=1 Tax=Micromonospora reichwaldensis TaxID=3075516 RepID=A0ABU2WUP2_9ACTN|nr:RNA degradosome polyphosphate kinase [Micromonospora sp. DSM 115977]MDT0528787.1 RNA degradosome polyphosphate kinase [Micromonospora sp. DSM 115977]
MSTPRKPSANRPSTDPAAPRNGARSRGADGRFHADPPATTPEAAPAAAPGGAPAATPAGASAATGTADAGGAAASAGLEEVLDAAPTAEVPAPDLIDGPPAAEPLPEDRFLNRELSWLDFNARVLALAEDPRTPLLERAKFLAIFASNLDEFYMVRVAGLKRRLQAGLPVRGGDRMPLRTQLELVAGKAATLVARHSACFTDEVLPKLAAEDIRILRWADLDDPERERLRAYFREQIFPVLTPLAVDPAHPFPYISGRSLNLAVAVRDPDGGSEFFARVKVPNNVPRFVRVHRDRPGVRMLPVEDLISVHLGQLFSGMQVVECHLFRVTRNAEVEVDEDRDEDLLQALERELARRRFGPPVRLEVAASVSDHVLELLVRELDMHDQEVLRVPGLLDLSALWQLYDEADRPDLKDPPFVPATHPRLTEGEVPRSVFATLRDGDILVHHPYHSFATSVQRFIEQAAADPDVLAIKQTLYRTSGDSPIVDALVDAAAAGKQVVVLVELKARFDEVANIGWARKLERAGCHVVYGLVGLKTHCKTALVVRQEGNQIRRYCHIGTGNYHPKTARLYEDFGMLTADPEIGADLTDLFNVLTGYSRQTAYRRLLVAPQGIRSGLIERIEREIAHVRLGMPGLVQIKVNSLVDEKITDALYRASRAGVHVDLVIRGMCTLRPGVPGLSENIRVRSILGRFLEHSRIFRFGNDGDAEFWMGSADLMHRNLDRRVEALVRVSDPVARAELDHVLTAAMSPDVDAFELAADGTWSRRTGTAEEPRVHLQELLLRRVGGTAG